MTTPVVSVSSPLPNQPDNPRPTPVAPLWHTLILVAFILLTSLFQPLYLPRLYGQAHHSRLANYAFMIAFELILVVYVWLAGLRRSGTPLSEIIGGRWMRWTDPLRDFGIAILFWIAVVAVLVPIGLLLGKNPAGQQAMRYLSPRSSAEVVAWFFIAAAAGFCEEIVFRGYLQRQILAFSGNTTLAVVTQAVIFGAAHAYQGYRGMISITVYGALFGILAVLCRSLRPGMMQHFLQDLTAGLVAARFLK